MRQLKLAGCLALLSMAAFAEGGLYVGVGAGLGSINVATSNGFELGNGSGNQGANNMAGSIYLGYDFSRYVGIQMDYDYIASVTIPTTSNGVQGSSSLSQQILDFGITGHLPFGLFANALSGLSIFGKLALGYTTASFNGGSLSTTGGNNNTQLPGNANSLVPVIGAGVEYGWNNVGVRAEYDYIGNTAVSASNQTMLNLSDSLLMLSVMYHF